MEKEFFFVLTKKDDISPIECMYGFGVKNYELYLVNNSDNTVTLKRTSYGGFKTYDEDIVAMATPHDNETNEIIEPHGYIPYCEMGDDDFEGANQYKSLIETPDCMKELEFHATNGVGMLSTFVPCLNKYGWIIRPRISDFHS